MSADNVKPKKNPEDEEERGEEGAERDQPGERRRIYDRDMANEWIFALRHLMLTRFPQSGKP